MKRDLDWVVTAHTANDVAETLLIRLLANKELNSIERKDQRRRCLRPLLDVSRDQIEEYARRYRVECIEDPTNADTALLRNRVRHTLLPRLERDFDPSVVWTLSERAQALASDCQALEVLALGVVSEVGGLQEGDPGWLSRCSTALGSLPFGLQWRVVQALLEPLMGFEVGEKSAEAALQVLLKEQPSCQLRADLTLRHDRFGLHLKGTKR